MKRIRLCKGRLLDPARKLDRRGDVWIADGRIAGIVKAPADFTPDLELDVSGKLVIPGVVDLCARLREPGAEYKATIASEAAAAAAGGITTLCCPPDTVPVIDNSSVLELIHRRAGTAGGVRVLALGALTRGLAGETLAEMHALRRAGCAGVSNGRAPIPDSEVLRRAMEYAAGFGLTVHVYPEDHYLRNSGVVHEGAVSTRLGLPPIPAAAETVAVARALLLAEQTGARLHLCRISSARSLELIGAARSRGLPVTADTAVCNLVLDEHAVEGYDANCHLLPPLRTAADRHALREAVNSGVLDAVCSDHAPHDDDAKAAPFSLTEPGASTLEHLLPLMLDLAGAGDIDLAAAVRALTSGPSGILGVESGGLSVGAPADLAVADPGGALEVRPETMHSAGRNTPFAGRTLRGSVVHTLYGGRFTHGSPP